MGSRAAAVIIAFVAAVIHLAGCAAPPYQSALAGYVGVPGGYEERANRDGTWRVRFTGNRNTTLETLQAYWLYRCAELTLQKEYDGFQIISHVQLVDDDGELRTRRPPQDWQLLDLPPVPPPATFAGNIRMLRAPITTEPRKTFDARALKMALEPHVAGPKCEDGNVCPHSRDYLGTDTAK